MKRLKDLRARKSQLFELQRSKNDSVELSIPTSTDDAVQKQKARLMDSLRAALKIKGLVINPTSALKPLNPNRFDASGGDSTSMIPTLRHESSSSPSSGSSRVVSRAYLEDSPHDAPFLPLTRRQGSPSPLTIERWNDTCVGSSDPPKFPVKRLDVDFQDEGNVVNWNARQEESQSSSNVAADTAPRKPGRARGA